jgi:hypothetical protein
MVKRLLTLIFILALGGQIFAQSTNKCWSIDYETWNTTGTPALYIDCGNDEAFNLGGELSLEAWVRAYTFAENRKFMGKVLYNEPIDNGYVLGFENLHVYAEYFNPTKQEVPRPGDGPMPPDSSFVHIVTTYSISDGKIKSYVNGMLAGETTMFPNTAIVDNDRPFIIGNAPWDLLSYQFYGDMDEVRVWNIALSQEQIQNKMHSQLSGNEEGLVAYYNFNEADGANIPDSGPNGFNGTLSNFDHESTTFATSSAPVGDEIMAQMQDVDAIWYRNSENYHKLITNNGIIVTGFILEKDFRKYLVAGNNGNDGVENTFAPVTNPTDFVRTNREWYFNTAGDISGGLTITLSDAGVNSDFPNNENPENYALLYRASETDNFRALVHPIIPFEGIFQFNDQLFKDGFYALAYSSEEFELQGPDAVEDAIFQHLKLSPNPTSNLLTINGTPLNTTISLLNTNGLLINKYQINENTTSIDLSNLANGLYFIQFELNGQKIVKKVIKN